MMQQSFNLEQVNYNIQSVKDTKTTACAYSICRLFSCEKQGTVTHCIHAASSHDIIFCTNIVQNF